MSASQRSHPSTAARIAVYGATGHTGRRVAAELVRRGVPVLLAGRDRLRLEALQDELSGDCICAVAALDDTAALVSAFKACSAVIGCAGPFSLYGEAVVKAAVGAGIHYVDVSGEQRFIQDVFEKYGEAAIQAKAAIIPACAIDIIPGDMLATLASKDMGALDRITVVIDIAGGRTHSGSMLTVLDSARRREGLRYADGALSPAPLSLDGGPWMLGGSKPISLMRFSGAEVVMLPRHLPVRNLDVYFTAGSSFPSWFPRRLALALMSCAEAMARTPIYPILRRGIERLPAPKADIEKITVEVELRSASHIRRAIMTAPGGYRFTCAAVCEAATRTSQPGFDRMGPLTPAQAFDPTDFMDSLKACGVQYQVDSTLTPIAKG